jgi:hypothetical protein
MPASKCEVPNSNPSTTKKQKVPGVLESPINGQRKDNFCTKKKPAQM